MEKQENEKKKKKQPYKIEKFYSAGLKFCNNLTNKKSKRPEGTFSLHS